LNGKKQLEDEEEEKNHRNCWKNPASHATMAGDEQKGGGKKR